MHRTINVKLVFNIPFEVKIGVRGFRRVLVVITICCYSIERTRYFNLNALFLQYCMMEHFFNSDYKVLCCSISELSQNIGSLRKEQLEELRQLPSFRRYVDSLPKKEKAPLLLDDCLFKVSEVNDYKKIPG